MSQPSDHDLLIAHSVKIDSLCTLVKTIDNRIGTYTDKLDIKCGGLHGGISDTHKELFFKIDQKTDDVTFRWIVGTLIFVMLAMAGFASTCVIGTQTNQEDIARIEKVIKEWRP